MAPSRFAVKMRGSVLMFAAGLVIASAFPLEQPVTTSPNDAQTQSASLETHSNKHESEQSSEITNTGVAAKGKHTDNVDVVEEFSDIPLELDLITPEVGAFYVDGVPVVVERNHLRNVVVDLEDEVMESAQSASIAAGFSIRKRNKKPGRNPVTRRRNNSQHRRKNPFNIRKISYPYYYPYYYSGFYRPSSLRYY